MLTCPRLLLVIRRRDGTAAVVRLEKYHGVFNVCVILEILDGGSSLIHLFMKDDGFEAELGKVACGFMLRGAIVAMHRDDPLRAWRRRAGTLYRRGGHILHLD